LDDRALSIQVSRRINNWCWRHWSSGFGVTLLVSAFAITLLACIATLAIFLASTATTSLASTFLACIVLATLAAIAALVASEDAL
jgi:Fe2+ transport system protein B